MSFVLISVIIANLNGERYLRGCLSALAAQTFRDFEVIVVDNGSADGSLRLIGSEFPWVRVIPLGSNTGFARGNNIGFAASSGKYIATLNNDTIAGRDWLTSLLQAAEADERVGMVASKILLGAEGGVIDSAGMLVYPDGMTRQRGRGETDDGRFDSAEEVLFPSACAALYRRKMIEETGFFDEDFFSYCEDADLGLRGRLAGWKAVLAPTAVVRHLYSGTGGKYSSFKAFHVERNRFMVLLKDLPLSYIIMSPFYTAWRYLVQMYGLLSGKGSVARFAEGSGRGEMVKVIARAYGGIISGVPDALRKRKKVREFRHITAAGYRELLRRHRISAAELMLRE
jgi:GT2 family glycosyltransferase